MFKLYGSACKSVHAAGGELKHMFVFVVVVVVFLAMRRV